MRIATLIATVVLGAGVVSAQSLGDAARQERIRRAGLEKHSKVLSNEDLSRQQILSPDARESAARPAASTPQPAPRADAPALVDNRRAVPAAPATRWETQEISLGAYARTIRAERAQREARANSDQIANAKSERPAPQEERTWRADSGVPAWTAAEQPNFSLGEYARAQLALRRKDVPIQLTLDAKAAPAAAIPAPKAAPSLTASQKRKTPPSGSMAAPIAPSAEAILVRAGDSLWKLSRSHLGEGRLWTAIWAANPQVHNPDMIHPGQSLSRPTEVRLAAARQAFSTKPAVVAANLSPAPHPASVNSQLRSVGLQLGDKQQGKRITGQVDVPAEVALLVRRPEGARNHRAAAHLPVAVRPVLPDLPGHRGLR